MDIMDENRSFIYELVGKKILVKTKGGLGVKDIILVEGTYSGILLGFDGSFLKIEYEVRKFLNGIQTVTKDVILINIAYIITAEEYKIKE